MDLGLRGKVVLIAGSSYGLGKAVAEGFLGEGANVVLTGRDRAQLEETESFLSTTCGNSARIMSYPGDLTKLDTIRACLNSVLEHLGRIDVLVANIGSGAGSRAWNIPEDDWDAMFEKNFDGARRITTEVLGAMVNQGGGSVVFVSSIAGVETIGAPIHYSVAKAALIAYAKNLSRKVAENNIRVNTVAPGNILFEKGTWDRKLKDDKDGVLAMLRATVPQNRFATPREISDFIVFVASERASFMTGSCIIVDGGQTATI